VAAIKQELIKRIQESDYEEEEGEKSEWVVHVDDQEEVKGRVADLILHELLCDTAAAVHEAVGGT